MTVEDFQKNFAAEDVVEAKVAEGPFKSFATEEDFNTYNENLKAPEYGRGVDDGKKNATEVFIKEINKSEGLELTNSQLNQENLINAIKGKYGSDNKALIEQFDADKKLLLDRINDQEGKFTEALAQKEREIRHIGLKTESLQGIKNETVFDKFDGIDLIMKDVEVIKDAAGKEFIHYKGQQMKNDNLEPLSMAEVTNNVFIEKGWYKEDAGRGGGNEHKGGGTTNSYKAFVKEMEEKGVHQGSVAYQDEFEKRMEDKDFAKSVQEA